MRQRLVQTGMFWELRPTEAEIAAINASRRVARAAAVSSDPWRCRRCRKPLVLPDSACTACGASGG